MNDRQSNAATPGEGAFSAYVRQLGDMSRLTADEEVYHATAFVDNRRLFLQHACWFPTPLAAAFRKAKTTDVSFAGDAGAEGVRQQRRERLTALIATIDAVIAQFDAAPVGDDGDQRRTLAAATLGRAMASLQLATSVCHRLFAELESAAKLLGPSAPPSQLDEPARKRAAEQLHYRPPSSDLAWHAAIPHYRAMSTSRDVLLEANLRLVVSVCKKYRNCGLPYSDLIQEGNIGLVHAVDRFEPERGHRFSTYAVWWIRQSITTALSTHGRTIRIPANMAATLYKIRQAEQALLQQLGREPTAAEIAKEIDLDPQRVSALRKMQQQTISLQSTIDSDSGRSLAEIFEDESSRRPDEDLAMPMLNAAIGEVLRTLNDRERAIIIARFGLNGANTETLEALSTQFGVSYERIRQIEAAALKKMRHPSVRHYFDGYA